MSTYNDSNGLHLPHPLLLTDEVFIDQSSKIIASIGTAFYKVF